MDCNMFVLIIRFTTGVLIKSKVVTVGKTCSYTLIIIFLFGYKKSKEDANIANITINITNFVYSCLYIIIMAHNYL